jgi:hypothetical protein
LTILFAELDKERVEEGEGFPQRYSRGEKEESAYLAGERPPSLPLESSPESSLVGGQSRTGIAPNGSNGSIT